LGRSHWCKKRQSDLLAKAEFLESLCSISYSFSINSEPWAEGAAGDVNSLDRRKPKWWRSARAEFRQQLLNRVSRDRFTSSQHHRERRRWTWLVSSSAHCIVHVLTAGFRHHQSIVRQRPGTFIENPRRLPHPSTGDLASAQCAARRCRTLSSVGVLPMGAYHRGLFPSCRRASAGQKAWPSIEGQAHLQPCPALTAHSWRREQAARNLWCSRSRSA
jgi:hypothetical protein